MSYLFRTGHIFRTALAVLAGLSIIGLSSCEKDPVEKPDDEKDDDGGSQVIVDYSSYQNAIQADIDALQAIVEDITVLTVADLSEDSNGLTTISFSDNSTANISNGGSVDTLTPPRLALVPNEDAEGLLYVWAWINEDGSATTYPAKPLVRISDEGVWEVSTDGTNYTSTDLSLTADVNADFVTVTENDSTVVISLCGDNSLQVPFEEIFSFYFTERDGGPLESEVQRIPYGASVTFGYITNQYADITFDTPEGWTAEISGEEVIVTAPANDSYASEGLITANVTCAHVTQPVSSIEVVAYRALQVGDYYYADGTISSELNTDKDIVGVVFYVGNPAADDEVLAADHPECVNGLVVSLSHPSQKQYLADAYAYSTVRPIAWYESDSVNITYTNSFYVSDYSTEASSLLDYARGYANTKVLTEYNNSVIYTNVYGENSGNCDILNALNAWKAENPAPANTSDWFIPSTKEMLQMIAGDTTLYCYEARGNSLTDNLVLLNGKLENVMGSTPIISATSGSSYNRYYWTSNVTKNSSGDERGVVFTVATTQYALTSFDYSLYIRPIFAF